MQVSWPTAFLRELITEGQEIDDQDAAEKDHQLVNGIEAQTIVVKAGGALWRELKSWGMTHRLLTPTEAGILDVAAAVPGKLPSEKQSVIAVATLRKMQKEGCELGSDLL